MKRNFSAVLRLVLSIIALCLFVVGAIATFNILKWEDSTKWIQQSHHTLQELERIIADYKGIQASYADYLLTQKEIYAVACREEMRDLREDLENIRTLVGGETILLGWSQNLESLVEKRMLLSERGLELCEQGQRDTAIAEFKLVNEKKNAQAVKDLVSQMSKVLAWVVKSRLALESTTSHRNVRLIAGGLAFTLLVCAAAAFFVGRQAMARQRTIKLLKSNEKKFRFLSETAADSFLTLDSSGLILVANPAAEAMFGFEKDDLLGKSFPHLLAESFQKEAGEKPFKVFLDLVYKPGMGAMEIDARRRDGVEFPMEVSVSKWTIREDTFYGLIARDITERKFFVKTLLNNEHRLFQFLDAVPAGILVRDKMGMHYFANRKAKELLGQEIKRDRVPPQELSEQYHLFRAGTPQLYPAEEFPILRALAGERSRVDDVEIRLPRKIIPVEVWGTPILDENANVKYSLCVLIDLTRQRAITESLKEREEFFRNLFEEGPIGMNLSFPDTSVASVNRAFCEMLGYSKNELIGKSFLDLTHPEDRPSDKALSQKLFDKTLPRYQIEKRFLTKSGTPIWCKVSASSILDLEGTPMFRLAIVENITEQRESATALKENEARFRTLTESANDGIISSDSKGNLVFFNSAAERIFGYSRDEALGSPMKNLMSEKSWKDNLALIQRYLTTGQATLPGNTLELTGRRKDGTEFPAEISYFSWKTASGLFFTSILRDITERKQVDEMKRDLVSVVSHQLKTPVAEINGYIENLLEGLAGEITPRQREYLNDMKDIGTDNYRLISDLLNMSKLERGVMTVDLQPVSLSEILELSLRDYEENIRRKGLEFNLDNAQTQAMVLADKDKTVETLRNIINNAIKCTDKGGITLKTHRENGFSLVEVRDTGIGMDPETMNRLFTRERVMGQEAARAGSGLGLYIAKSFMNLQNGDITVKSEKGKGSSFFIKIPVAKQGEEHE